jgi:rod shape-determining protein MreD
MMSVLGSFPLFITVLIALFLTGVSLPEKLVPYWPDWIVLVLIYWGMARPGRVSVFFGWFIGLLVDVMHGSLLGQNALALTLISYIVNILHLRMRMFPLLQQSFFIVMLVALHLGITAWIRGMTGEFVITPLYWMPAFVSGVVWPVLFITLRDVRRSGMKR